MTSDSKTMSPMNILKTFFGYKPGQTLKEFAAEVKTLSLDEKTELVNLAAVALGVTVAESQS